MTRRRHAGLGRSARRTSHVAVPLILWRVPIIELLYWDGCPSHPKALADLQAALVELGRPELEVTVTEVSTEQEAAQLKFLGSPTVRIDGIDPLPSGGEGPAGLTCRVYRRRDGRYSPTPDPDDLRAALRRLLSPAATQA